MSCLPSSHRSHLFPLLIGTGLFAFWAWSAQAQPAPAALPSAATPSASPGVAPSPSSTSAPAPAGSAPRQETAPFAAPAGAQGEPAPSANAAPVAAVPVPSAEPVVQPAPVPVPMAASTAAPTPAAKVAAPGSPQVWTPSAAEGQSKGRMPKVRKGAEEWAVQGQVDPAEQMPGNAVARPLTLPEGTLAMSFTEYAAFIDTSADVGWIPTFALGVTPELEVGVDLPFRYDQSRKLWTSLSPRPHLGMTWLSSWDIELGGRLAALIPAADDTDLQFEVGVPLLWRPARSLRLDAAVHLDIAAEGEVQAAARVPLAMTLQALPWFYAGLAGNADIGITDQRKTAMDASALLGLTLQSRGRARIDLIGRFFLENLGAAEEDRLSDGGGIIATLAFFPELY